MICWFIDAPSFWAKMRALMSVGPPGGKLEHEGPRLRVRGAQPGQDPRDGLHVVLRVHAQFRKCARDAILEHLLQLVPRSARHLLHLLCLRRRGAARRGRRLGGDPFGSILQLLALLDQGLEQFRAFLLRPRETAPPREPDLVRRIEHALRHFFRRLGLSRRKFRLRFLQHRAFS